MSKKYDSEFTSWIAKEKKAIELINIVGQLWFDKSIELILFRKPLFDCSGSEILAHHQYVQEITGTEISIYQTLEIAKGISELIIAPSRIDIGKLTIEWLNEGNQAKSIEDFLLQKLQKHVGKDKKTMVPKDVILYGFGRIGRIAARELIVQAGKGEQLRLRAIVTRTYSDEELRKRADLLRNDSVHGGFPGIIKEDYEHKALNINGQLIYLIAANIGR